MTNKNVVAAGHEERVSILVNLKGQQAPLKLHRVPDKEPLPCVTEISKLV